MANIPLFAARLKALVESSKKPDKSGKMVLNGPLDYHRTKTMIDATLDELNSGFPPEEPTVLTLPVLKEQLPNIELTKLRRNILSLNELQLSEKLRNIFPLIHSIEVASQSINDHEVSFNFLVKNAREIPRKGQIEEYFSFNVLSSANEASILPDLIDIKLTEGEGDKPIISSIETLLLQIATETLEALNRKQSPKEKPSASKINQTVISVLEGATRPQAQMLSPKKTKAAPAIHETASQPQPEKPRKAILSTDNLNTFDLSRFGVSSHEVAEKIKQAVAHWNEHGNLGQSRLRSRENKYRIACMVGKIPLRIFFEMQSDPSSPIGKKLVITEVRKRNESTYKGLS